MSAINGIGRVSSSTVSATAVLLLAQASVLRDAVLLTNHDADSWLLVALGGFSAAPYSMSSTATTFRVAPKDTLEINVGKDVGLWIKAEDGSTINYTATEVSS